MMRDRLSDKRISEVSTEFNNKFNTWAAARQIFDVVNVDDLQSDEDIQNDDFVKITINRITKRDFFTEDKRAIFYDHIGIGTRCGKSIAVGEMTHVHNIMMDCKDVIGLDKKDMTNYLNKFINGNSDIDDLAILMSPVNFTTFWGDNEFTVVNRKSIWGFINRIPMYWTTVIPRDRFYIFNKNIGKLIVKTDAHIDISEISKQEYDKIIENIPTITKDELENYVRVKANEVIQFSLRARPK